MKKKDIKPRILSGYAETTASWTSWKTQAKQDFQMVMGLQWDQDTLKELQAKNAPALVINLILKHINVISGIERQGRGDLKALPIEGGDELTSEVLSMVLKWIMTDRNCEFVESDAFKDALICGMGWKHPYVYYDEDPHNGDITEKKLSPLDMWPDPHFTERDLSDCEYIIRSKRLQKHRLARLYPNYEKEIMSKTATQFSDTNYGQDANLPNDLGEKLRVVEFWHREYEKVTFIMDTMRKEDMQRWEGSRKDLDAILKENPTFVAIKREVSVMKLAVLIEDDLLVYDDLSPYGGNEYPFVPIFCFYYSAWGDWKDKCQGIVRALKDLQKEKNKRRSVIMQAFNMMPHSYWLMEKGALADKTVLTRSAGIGKIIEVMPGRMQSVMAQPGPEIPQSALTLEQLNNDDITMVGSNPDLLGQMLEKGAPGIAIQLRQKQGVTVLQEIFDSHRLSKILTGKRIIKMILDNFSVDKIKRILGDDFYYTDLLKKLTKQLKETMMQSPMPVELPPQISQSDEMAHSMASPGAQRVIEQKILADKNAQEAQMMQQQVAMIHTRALQIKQQIDDVAQEEAAFWVNFEKEKREMRYDCTVDETTSSLTFRYAILQQLQEWQKYGVQIPFEIIVEYMGLPKATKEKWKESQAQQQQMAQQMAQQSSRKSIKLQHGEDGQIMGAEVNQL